MSLRFELLGELRAARATEELTLGGRKQKAVLAALLLERGRVVAKERLLEAVWGEDPAESAGRTLQVYISNLRKATRSDLIVSRGSGYAIELGDDELDLIDFEDAVAAANRAFEAGRFDEAVESAEQALALFGGSPLLEFADVGFFVPDAVRLADARLSVQVIKHEAQLMGDRGPVTMIPDLERAAVEHPLDERLHALLMTAQYRAGRQADALETYTSLRARLVEELGLDPSPALQALERRIIAEDPALMSPVAALDATRTVRVGVGSDEVNARLEVDGRPVSLVAAVTTVGRLPDRTIVLSDPDVSRRHAEIRRTSAGYLLVDCDSTNGVTVNGERVGSAPLSDGDLIDIGDTTLRFVEER